VYHSCRYTQCRRGAYRFTSGCRRRRIITSWWRRVQASAAEHIRHVDGCCTAVDRQVRSGYESLFAVRRRLIPVLHVQSCIVTAVTISGERLPDHRCLIIVIIEMLSRRGPARRMVAGRQVQSVPPQPVLHIMWTLSVLQYRGWSDCCRKCASDPPPPHAEGV